MIPLLLALTTLSASAAEFRSAEDVLATFKGEPTIRDVQVMAEDYARTDPSYLDAWMKAAKSAAWLPQLTLEYDYDNDYDTDYDYFQQSEDSSLSDFQVNGSSVGIGHTAKAKARWDLNELVMSSERIRVINETQDVVRLRDKVLEDVTRLYFERRKLQCDMLLNPGDMKEQLKAELRKQELEAQLDAYTGGRFTKAVAKR